MNDCVAVYMLDVGQGDCTVILLPDNGVVVFDCADDHVLRKILDDWNTPRIDAFVLSHLDQDHIAGALQFLEAWSKPIQCVCLNTDRDISPNTDAAKKAKSLLEYVKQQSRIGEGSVRRWELVTNNRDFRALACGEEVDQARRAGACSAYRSSSRGRVAGRESLLFDTARRSGRGRHACRWRRSTPIME